MSSQHILLQPLPEPWHFINRPPDPSHSCPAPLPPPSLQSLLWQCVDAAMVRVEMRPDRARAAREAAELTANWPITAGTLARQFGER